MLNPFELQCRLTAAAMPSGYESPCGEVIAEIARPFCDEQWYTPTGSLVCRKKGSGKKLMFAAHMDSIGFVVTHIEKEGFLRVGKVGGVSPTAVLHTPIRFKNGVRGMIYADGKADSKSLGIDDLVLDIGAKSREKAEKLVKVGDTAVYDTPSFSAGTRLVSPYMDNRISCVVLLMALEQLR